MNDRIISGEKMSDDNFEKTIRPESIDEYVGQTEVK